MENEKVNKTYKELIEKAADKVLPKIIKQLSAGYLPNLEVKAKGLERFNLRFTDSDMSDTEISEMTMIVKNFCDAIKHVKNNKNLSSRLSAQKILESLSPFIKGKSSNTPFWYPHIEIDLRSEINPKLIEEYNQLRRENKEMLEYEIIEDTEMKEFMVLNTINENILIHENYLLKLPLDDEQSLPLKSFWSISEIYPYWLPSVTQEKMRQQDLFEQIMIAYTIKRAYLGDEKAVKALYNLFENTAEGIAIMMAKDKRGKFRVDLTEAKSEARSLLSMLLSGFSPIWYLEELRKGEKPGYYQNWIAKTVVAYYTTVAYPMIQRLNWPLVSQINLLNPYEVLLKTDIHEQIKNIEHFIDPKETPYGRKLNSFVFRPNRKTNLYTWLFGVKKEPVKGITGGFMLGKFCQLMYEFINKHAKTQREASHDFLDEGEEDETGQEFNYRQKIIKDKKSGKRRVDDEIVERAVEELVGNGISKRNAEIFLKHKLQGFNKTELARMYALDRRQIYRICKNLSIKYPS